MLKEVTFMDITGSLSDEVGLMGIIQLRELM